LQGEKLNLLEKQLDESTRCLNDEREEKLEKYNLYANNQFIVIFLTPHVLYFICRLAQSEQLEKRIQKLLAEKQALSEEKNQILDKLKSDENISAVLKQLQDEKASYKHQISI